MKKLLVIKPSKYVEIKSYSDEHKINLNDFKCLVNGYIETVPAFDEKYLLVVNEEGKLNHSEPNFVATNLLASWINDVLVGDVVIARAGEDDIAALTQEDVNFWMQFLLKREPEHEK